MHAVVIAHGYIKQHAVQHHHPSLLYLYILSPWFCGRKKKTVNESPQTHLSTSFYPPCLPNALLFSFSCSSLSIIPHARLFFCAAARHKQKYSSYSHNNNGKTSVEGKKGRKTFIELDSDEWVGRDRTGERGGVV